ncbi:pyruvate dehydrogenase complex dihydrolipoamide acetyltransferase [Croceiramulus getboli]|nr:pyruvate dehydrogenase complex dihydrolipoamide acetyltransferase [Flavobacteriaceae bacterium YJPT1-3]
MAEVIKMPRLSDTMEEGTVAQWLKKKGDKVEEGDILAEIETDKATMEFESFYEGTLLHIGIQEGETADVDALLAIIGEEGEDISALIDGGGDPKTEEKSESESEDSAAQEDSEKETEIQDDTSEEDASESTDEVPEGVEVVNMPRLSDTMEEGTVATWLKKEGDTVEEGDILAEIETDKATMEFESFYAGTLLHIGIDEGETAKVDSLLAIIGPEGTDVSGIIANAKSGSGSKKSAPKKEEPKKEESKAEAAPKKEESKKEEAPKAEAPKKKSAKSSSDGRIIASPLAKRLAEEKGIDLNQVEGTGDHGRIVRRDIENYTPSAASSGLAQFEPTGEESFEEVNNSQMRKAIAKSLSKSKFTAPHYYLNVEFNMENAMAFRSQFNQLPDTKISYNDMIVLATAMALKQHPQVNSQWFDDKMRLNHHVHIGVAVAVPDGLVVPVVRFANEKKLQQINAEVKELAGKARDKKLKLEEMEGSTFTISNLGMFGITDFTSIINQPNSAILSVGAIVEKPVVKEGKIVVGHTMKLTMACDHRTVDGATGAQFLQTLKTYIENPVLMLA